MEHLNQEQERAVRHMEGPLLVLAGAGSGKTRVVTARIVHLLKQGVPPSEILGLTFTNKAAENMRSRVQQLTSCQVLICTFHSLGVRILRESGIVLGYPSHFTIYDEEDCLKLLKFCLATLNINEKELPPKLFKELISKAKNRLFSPEEVINTEGTIAEELLPRVYELYQTKIKEYQAVDFDDLLYLPVKLFREYPEVLQHYQQRWRFLLVDEYQDTNQAQYRIINDLVAPTGNLFVVGDPDQSIYSWRGADIQNILEFESTYPNAQVVRLEQNYRSSQTILDAANSLIRNNIQRYEKKLWSTIKDAEKLTLFVGDTERQEAEFVIDQILFQQRARGVPFNEMAIFYRTNFQSRLFEDALLRRKIPYIIVGGISFYQRREIKDILSFLKLVHTPSDFVAFARAINIPRRGIGEVTLEKLRAGAEKASLPIFTYCEALLAGQITTPPSLGSKAKQGLFELVQLVKELIATYKNQGLRSLVSSAIHNSHYLTFLKAEDETSYEDRKANLNELLSKATEWETFTNDPSLSHFLEELSLKSSLDEATPEELSVNLMTIHHGKGLEFLSTFLVGMEEELFPHANSRGNPEAIEEERRLCYVGMTRAKKYLYVTAAKSRMLWGTIRTMRPSRFLSEIPREYFR